LLATRQLFGSYQQEVNQGMGRDGIAAMIDYVIVINIQRQ
jgi:hypothetical protein